MPYEISEDSSSSEVSSGSFSDSAYSCSSDDGCDPYLSASRFEVKRPRETEKTYTQSKTRRLNAKNERDGDNTRSSAQNQGGNAGVYVLRSKETGVFYVGKSNNIQLRISQHERENRGDILTRENTLTIGTASDLESWERNEVLTRMYHSGMDSVRGWKYTRRGALTWDEKISARNDIMEKFDLCRRCGHNNHFANKCFARSPALWCKDIPM
jgi:ribosomal protein S8E